MFHVRHNDGKHYNEDEKSSPFVNDLFFFFCAYSSVCFHRCFKCVNWDYVNISTRSTIIAKKKETEKNRSSETGRHLG